MAVYVDEPFTAVARGAEARRTGARHGHQWCHMWADTLEELHALAARIGMRPAWFQDKPGFPHYDLVPTRRAQAIQLGAQVKDLREVIKERIVARRAREAAEPPMCGPAAIV